MTIAVVTDSTACLPPDQIERYAMAVVPLVVVIDGVAGLEGVDVGPDQVAAVLRTRRLAVGTSRPSPARFAEAYRRLLDAGASGVVSVHLSAKLSATWESATLAARQVGAAVTVVDSGSIGMGLGFSALAAAEAAVQGEGLSGVRDAALAAAARTRTFFYVDTLEFLRRGGRVSATSAVLGTALSVKPILQVVDGGIVLRDKVRTTSRALGRLVELAAEAAGESDVDIAVHYLDTPERASGIERALDGRLGGRLRERHTTQVGAAVAVHTGPGLAAVVVRQRAG